MRIDALHSGRLEPHGPIDFEGIVDQRVMLQVRGTFEGMRRLSRSMGLHTGKTSSRISSSALTPG